MDRWTFSEAIGDSVQRCEMSRKFIMRLSSTFYRVPTHSVKIPQKGDVSVTCPIYTSLWRSAVDRSSVNPRARVRPNQMHRSASGLCESGRITIIIAGATVLTKRRQQSMDVKGRLNRFALM